jgi:Zn-dependent alcohol dehydrogenase
MTTGAGRILRLGSKKQEAKFKEGDLVILSAAACLECLYCTTGHPAYCVQHSALTSQANTPTFVLASDPSKVFGGGFFGQSSFASPAPVKVSSAVNVTKSVRDAAELKLYAPIGCGIMTGAGTVTHVGKCGPKDVIAVVGLGGVGLAGLAAAKERGVGTIIACDVVASRIELAKKFGATVGLNTSKEGLGGKSISEALKEVTPEGLGCTHILDTTPSVAVLSECLEAVRNNGTVFQVGVKPVGAKLELDLLPHMVHGRKLVGVIEGDRDPAEALPELLQWSKDGVLPLEKMVTEFPVAEFEKARAAMEDGSVVKSVLVW